MKFYRGRGWKLDYYRHNHGNTRSTQTDNTSTPIIKNDYPDKPSTAENPLYRKEILLIVSIILLAVVVIVVLSVFTSPKYTHKCVFSNTGSSTTTCNFIGETTYKCIYATDKDIKCTKTKIVKDTAYSPHNFIVKSVVYEKINQSKYLSSCSYCGKEKEEIVNHSSLKYKSISGNWGVIGVDSNDVTKNSNMYLFESLLFTKESVKYSYTTKYFIVLKLYDTQENLYAIYYMQGHILTTKMCSHNFKIRDKEHITKYFDHRWEIATIRPTKGIELNYYN